MIITELKRILNCKLLEDYEDSIEDYHELYNNLLYKTIDEIVNAKEGEIQNFPKPLNPERMIKIWQDFSRTGIVRNSKYLQDIKDDFILKIAQLDVNNYLTGRDQHYPEYEFNEYVENNDISMTLDEFKDKTADYIENNSDYALPRFHKVLKDLYNSTTDEELLLCLDRILNVVHQRYDLAKLFVAGGRVVLDQLANENLNLFEEFKVENIDGKDYVDVSELKKLTNSQWNQAYKKIKKLGYDIRSVEDLQDMFFKRSRIVNNKISYYAYEDHLNVIKNIVNSQELKKLQPKSDEAKLVTKAVRYFGITLDPIFGGYILKDGRMLDLSGIRQGNRFARSRGLDHRKISVVYDEAIDGTDAMLNFISLGNIRMNCNNDSCSFDIGDKVPTPKQFSTIQSIVRRYVNKEAALDINNDLNKYYEILKPYEILNDIQNYFK